jgi:hypothetical protein
VLGWTVAVAMAWGLAWIAVARATTDLTSTPLVVAAGVAAVAALAAPAVLRGRAAS